jgi:uncharacterized protein YyaL (SSP411 family)
MKPNRLINESSPYLLQHAHNPVNWFAWSDEVFEKARAENKPIFLSIGYATCHWCHVMEKESFEDEEVARYLNETFISIKVDREERPDIDAVYMAACQALTGGGGWPLTIIMTPEKEPFFAGTYIPKHSQFGRIGLIDLCKRVQELWTSERTKLQDAAKSITQQLHQSFLFFAKSDVDKTLFDKAYTQLTQSYDHEFGGFEPAPKFPTPHRLRFLLRHYHHTGEIEALNMVQHTLKSMRQGGIWDHIGFGFHRYSTDRQWLLPHFEKMLYDQALIAMAYLETYQITHDHFYAQTADEIFSYVLRDMTSPEGAFFSAEDADSEGEEGRFYVWNWKEFENVLGKETAAIWQSIFNLQKEGNFSEEASGKSTGANILHITQPFDTWCTHLNMDLPALLHRWEKARSKLFEHRKQRIHPLKDDKILTDWNGLMIAALAMGSRILDNTQYTKAAQKGAQFILSTMSNEKGHLFHRYRMGNAGIPAHADDYAFFILGLLELYRTTYDLFYAQQAVTLQEQMISHFWDSSKGGFFLASNAQEGLPLRPKDLYDGAIPSANSVSLCNLIHFSRLTGDPKWEKLAHNLVHTFSGNVAQQPTAYSHFLMGLDSLLNPGQEIVVTGNPESNDTRLMLSILNKHFVPNRTVLHKFNGNANSLEEFAPFTKTITITNDHATAYICDNFSCHTPISDPQSLLKQLEEKH